MEAFAKADEVDFSDPEAVLTAALENELKGRKLYEQYARTVKSDMAKRVFEYLANEELTHIEDIKRFLEAAGDFSGIDVDSLITEDSLERSKQIFGKLIKNMRGRTEPSDDDNESREVAMEFEKNGYEYYQKGADATEDENLRRFLLWLVDQEKAHYMFIQNAFDYMNDPASWHASEESWLLEG